MSSPEGSTVTFRGTPAGVRRSPLRDFARVLERGVTRGKRFDCVITTDSELRRLNRQFRRKNTATDVLSFPAPPDAPKGYLGDLAISFDRARAQAREFGHATSVEIRVLMLHGVLHLTGLDHETDSGKMARAEARLRRRLGLPGGLIERASETS